jgi:L-ascorbate 6-phosphate lactonase
MSADTIKVKMLGQVGVRLACHDIVIYIDPYLSDYVEKTEGGNLKRLIPVEVAPSNILDANYVLITHEHIDHCDPETIIPLSISSAKCKFICSKPVSELLIGWGVDENRLINNANGVINISDEVIVHTLPSAHPTIVPLVDGGWECVGYVLEVQDKIIYHAGDTSVNEDLIIHLQKFNAIDVAFMPVNECNYYRKKNGIIGNMTIREAFQMATDVDVKIFIPTHWDMFECNQVYKEEIELLYEKLKPPFELLLYPEYI